MSETAGSTGVEFVEYSKNTLNPGKSFLYRRSAATNVLRNMTGHLVFQCHLVHSDSWTWATEQKSIRVSEAIHRDVSAWMEYGK